MVIGFIICIVVWLGIYAFLCVADIITEHIFQRIEKHTKNPIENYFLPWEEEP